MVHPTPESVAALFTAITGGIGSRIDWRRYRTKALVRSARFKQLG